MKSKIYDHLIVMAIIMVFYGVLFMLGIRCPIRFITGISCPGCGMTRALWSALHLDFGSAFSYHALWPLVVAFVICYVVSQYRNKTIRSEFIWILACIFIVYYLYRLLFMNSEIVVFRPKEGLLNKLYIFVSKHI